MHSNLAHAASRRLLFRAPTSTVKFSRRHVTPNHVARLPKIQSRSLFGFFGASKKKPQHADSRPGFPLMLELHHRLGKGRRPPAPAELAQAFEDFFRWHANQTNPLEDVEASHLIVTFNHLRESYKEKKGFGLSDEVLRLALDNLTLVPVDQLRHAAHVKLAELLYEELLQRQEKAPDAEKPEVLGEKDVANFIKILSRCGNASRARSLIEGRWSAREDHGDPYVLWLEVIEGFARQRATEEILTTIDTMQRFGLSFNSRVHQWIASYYAHRHDFELTKKWYKHPIAGGELPTRRTDRFVLRLCIMQNELEWGDPIFKSMIERGPQTLGDWGLVFQWALAQGKGVDEIERMMKVMVRRNEEKEISINPDSGIINGLIRTAILKNDAYTAERCVALGQRWGVTPDALTYLYQLEYRIKVGDLDGARSSYLQLREQDWEDPRNNGAVRKLGPVLNQLLCALCAKPRLDFEAVMRLVEDMKDQRVTFEVEAICALSRVHLQRGGTQDVVDLLNTHVLPYGWKKRAAVRDVLVSFCLDQPQTIARLWDTYTILRQLFPEVDVDTRTKFMIKFFERGRSDMACHVFGHMRRQDPGIMRPTVDTYVACFEGIGKAKDKESLEMVHNMLKLDTQIEPNTKLYNSLMLAFTGCGEARRGLNIWVDIVDSREGPSYRSIEIALRACEEAPFGDRNARGIWARLKEYNVKITKEIFAAYIGALAGNAQFEECVKLIEEFEKVPGYAPDAFL